MTVSAQLVFSPKHLSYFVGSTLKPQHYHRRRGDDGLPAVAVVSSDLDEDISLPQSVSDEVDQLARRTQFSGHVVAFRENLAARGHHSIVNEPLIRFRKGGPIAGILAVKWTACAYPASDIQTAMASDAAFHSPATAGAVLSRIRSLRVMIAARAFRSAISHRRLVPIVRVSVLRRSIRNLASSSGLMEAVRRTDRQYLAFNKLVSLVIASNCQPTINELIRWPWRSTFGTGR